MTKKSRHLAPMVIVIVSVLALTGYLALKPTRTPSPSSPTPTDYSTADWNSSSYTAEDSTPSAEGNRCGGVERLHCPEGYLCLTTQSLPTAKGVCSRAICPASDYIICTQQEGILEVGIYCTPHYSEWIRDNCPSVTLVY